MPRERPGHLILLLYWTRRIGFRLHVRFKAIDLVEEIVRNLFPNDHREAQHELVISNRSLAWPFTPSSGFRLWKREIDYGEYWY